METLKTDIASDRFFMFFKANYPWDWGSYEKFVWKHQNDPFSGSNDFYVLEEDKEIVSICVARKYIFKYGGSTYNILSMMDFVTASQYRQKGRISTILQYIYKNVDFDYSIGFSSRQLRETVHKKTNCVQTYYTYVFNPTVSPLSSMPCSDADAITALNLNERSFQIPRNQTYLNYIKNNPSYKNVVFLKRDDFVIGVAFERNEENSVRIVEMSDYSLSFCMTAYQMASVFGKPVKIDLPQVVDNGRFLKETCFDVFNPSSNYSIFHEGELIWVPHCDRK